VDKIDAKFQALSVLVVDDMDVIRNLVSSCLKELGVRKVFLSPNGSIAWNQLQDTPIDIIICDWDMPQVSGLELLKLIRASTKYNHIPFLMLTATTEKEKVVDAMEAGVSDFLSKPFSPKDLEYRVIKLLRKVKARK
jgi:two-component system chemotaxis response regulator CheY